MSQSTTTTDPNNSKAPKVEPGGAGATPTASAPAAAVATATAASGGAPTANGAVAGGTSGGSWPAAPLGAAGAGATGAATVSPAMSLPPQQEAPPKTRKKGLSVCVAAFITDSSQYAVENEISCENSLVFQHSGVLYLVVAVLSTLTVVPHVPRCGT